MRAGRYEEAWDVSAHVMALADPATRDDPAIAYHLRWVWDGTPVDGRDVLVRCYHGLGDTIQFARFLSPLARRARSVTVEVQPELIPVLASMEGITRFVPFDPAAPLPQGDCDVEITELSFALRMPPTIPSTPYLHAAPAAIPPGTIGLCHRAGGWDDERSLPAPLLAPLCAMAPCLSLMPGPTALPVINPDGSPVAIADTAAMIAGVDLIITVDTMVAHLAGALGRRTWLLLKAAPDWRWTPGARDNAWYPSMRLYTQEKAGDWASVLAQVEEDLRDEQMRSPVAIPSRPERPA